MLVFSALPIFFGCSSLNPVGWVTPHHIEIQQGNELSEALAAQIKPGMTRSQVRFLLGSPMVTDLFHNNRWDYPYQLYQDGKRVDTHIFTVFFNGDLVERVEKSSQSVNKPSHQEASPINPAALPK